MPHERRAHATRHVLLGGLLITACQAAEVCDPTAPVCSGGPGSVTSVTISSPVDSVMAVGRTASLTAAALDASSNPVTVSFNWISTNAATATADPSSGVVTALAAGVTHIEARQSTNPVFGDLRMRAVNANLPAVTALVGDSLAVALRRALTATAEGQVNGLLTTCAGHITSGHVRALDTCLIDATGVSGGASANDNALLGVLDRFLDHARRQLQL